MNKDKKYRLYGFMTPVLILFYMWHISTYDGINIWYFSGDFAGYLEHTLWKETSLSPTVTENLIIILYIFLNILAWLYRDKTANLIRKALGKI
jgi:hypothetical protein